MDKPTKTLRSIALMSIGMVIAVAPGQAGAAETAGPADGFAAKLQRVHRAIEFGDLSIRPADMDRNATDGSHAVKLAQSTPWNDYNPFRKYHPAFAQ